MTVEGNCDAATSRCPGLIVFDLDFTLWDCGGTWCDCLSPPFNHCDDRVVDSRSAHIRLYDDVPSILDWCDSHHISMALASRTQQPAWARELIKLLGVAHRFEFQEIYPTTKLKHFAALQQDTHLPYNEMLFFDDETRNIDEVGTLGVTCIHVPSGFCFDLFEAGIEAWRRNGCR